MPSCGASITAEGRGSLFCSYCGAKLRIKTGASGNPVAVLDGIKEDTSLMAKRSALGHVEEELSRVEEEREEVARNCEAKRAELDEARDPGCVGFVPLGLLMVGIVLVIQFLYGRIVQGVIGLLALGVVVAMYVAWNRYDAVTEGKRAALKSDAAWAVAEVDAKIATLRERAEGLRGEIDRSISEM